MVPLGIHLGTKGGYSYFAALEMFVVEAREANLELKE
jgi:hypothetical protein